MGALKRLKLLVVKPLNVAFLLLSLLLVNQYATLHRALKNTPTDNMLLSSGLTPPSAVGKLDSLTRKHDDAKSAVQTTTRVQPVSNNVSFEARFAPYFPSSAPLSDFVRKQMARKKPTWPLKVKTPILIASLPKSGTSSAWRYFICSGHLAAHTFGKLNQTTGVLLGDCIEKNIIENTNKPFEGCGHYYVWSDAGSITSLKEQGNPKCFYPSIHALPALYKAYPEMTILLLRRNVTKWAASVTRYADLAQRWQKCPREDMIPLGNDATRNLEQFYENHSNRLRQFAKDHPSITYVELELEGPNMGQQMEDAFGGPASCWRNCQPGMRFKDCKVV
jgi:hypothetical protein